MRTTKMRGNEVHLVGDEIKLGDMFPNFKASVNVVEDMNLNDVNGVRIILAVPSVDTPICDMELKKVASEVASLDGVNLIGISKDLPFAQSRWCVDVENEDIHIVSDFKHANFAELTGTLILETGLLTRASFVLDKDGKVQFAEYLEEIGMEPSYDKIMKVAKSLM
ncbi:thiol peroxidase [uncultured Clostridium sp.]|uniref:thiol peroxidase n=1 Tax=uncultured Clostridium sp. TaxID=59620 RepID=UPI00262FBC42|nr:thiol peroxidase [uncultured Clostridium sp.]